MTATCFVDTNILVYFRDANEPEKQTRSHEWLKLLWQERLGRTSFQVLQEYYVTVTRKLRPGLPPAEAQSDVKSYFLWSPSAVSENVLERAWRLQDRYALSFWDALIASSALEADCTYLISEDFTDGQNLAGLRIVNPFIHTPSVITGA